MQTEIANMVDDLSGNNKTKRLALEKLLIAKEELDRQEKIDNKDYLGEVVKRYPLGSGWELVKCRRGIYFKGLNYYAVSIPIHGTDGKEGSLYEMLNWICEYMDRRDEEYTDDKERGLRDTIRDLAIQILSLPMEAFSDDDFFMTVSGDIIDRKNYYYLDIAKKLGIEIPSHKQVEAEVMDYYGSDRREIERNLKREHAQRIDSERANNEGRKRKKEREAAELAKKNAVIKDW